MTNNRMTRNNSSSSSACAGGEHTLLYNSTTRSLYSVGACGLGWNRNHPITDTVFRLQKVMLRSNRPAAADADDNDNEPCHHRLFHASYYHNLAVGATTGRLYSWGCGTFVDTATENTDGTNANNKQHDNFDGIIPALGFKVTTSSSVSSSSRRRTDIGAFPEPVALNTQDLDNVHDPIQSLAAGAYHSVVLTKYKNIVYTFGAGQLGQLGRRLSFQNNHTNYTDSSGLPVDPHPAPVEGLDNISIQHTNDDDNDNTDTNTNTNDDTGGEAGRRRTVVDIGAGFYNTFAIVRNNTNTNSTNTNTRANSTNHKRWLYCAGENQNQQCGEGAKNLHTMVKVNELEKYDVARVDGGYCHTLIQTAAGKVFSMGCGEEGQRGDGKVLIDDDDDGDGDDDDNCITTRDILTPVLLPPGKKAIDIAAGANHSVILGDDGVAYTFGANDVGQCGISSSSSSSNNNNNNQNSSSNSSSSSSGDDNTNDTTTRTDTNINTGTPIVSPRPVVDLPNDAGRIVKVSAGYAHTVLTAANGRIFVFGQNDNGQLGISMGVNGNSDDCATTTPQQQNTNTNSSSIDQKPLLRPVEVKF